MIKLLASFDANRMVESAQNLQVLSKLLRDEGYYLNSNEITQTKLLEAENLSPTLVGLQKVKRAKYVLGGLAYNNKEYAKALYTLKAGNGNEDDVTRNQQAAKARWAEYENILRSLR